MSPAWEQAEHCPGRVGAETRELPRQCWHIRVATQAAEGGTGCSAPLSSRSLTVRGRSRDRPSNQNMKRKDAWNCRCSVDLAFVPVIRPKFAVLMSRTGVAGSA
jgi:hypothetical protein